MSRCGPHDDGRTENMAPGCGESFTDRAYYITSGRRMYCSRSCYIATRPRGHKRSFKTDYDRKRESVARYPDKHRCRHKFEYAVKSGKLVPEPCALCGLPDAEGHHWDYAKPYDVFWLCRQHNIDVHKLRITLILPSKPRLPAVHPRLKLRCRRRSVQLGSLPPHNGE